MRIYLLLGLSTAAALASSSAFGAGGCIPAPKNNVCPSGYQFITTAVADPRSPTKFREESSCCAYGPASKPIKNVGKSVKPIKKVGKSVKP